MAKFQNFKKSERKENYPEINLKKGNPTFLPLRGEGEPGESQRPDDNQTPRQKIPHTGDKESLNRCG